MPRVGRLFLGRLEASVFGHVSVREYTFTYTCYHTDLGQIIN